MGASEEPGADRAVGSGGDSQGYNGFILHFDGGAWTSVTTPYFLNRLWGTSGQNVFGVGSQGAAAHYDGVSWKAISLPVTNDLFGLWGTAGDDVFAVGSLQRNILVPDGKSHE